MTSPHMLDRRFPDELNQITGDIVDCAFNVHKSLGPGLLENSYEVCLKHDLIQRGHDVKSQLALPIRYNDIVLETGYRLDLLVDGQVIVELKSVERLENIHIAQVMTYLRHSQLHVGLLFNFNVVKLKDGIKRIVI